MAFEDPVRPAGRPPCPSRRPRQIDTQPVDTFGQDISSASPGGKLQIRSAVTDGM
jgi:hypothetical protein